MMLMNCLLNMPRLIALDISAQGLESLVLQCTFACCAGHRWQWRTSSRTAQRGIRSAEEKRVTHIYYNHTSHATTTTTIADNRYSDRYSYLQSTTYNYDIATCITTTTLYYNYIPTTTTTALQPQLPSYSVPWLYSVCCVLLVAVVTLPVLVGIPFALVAEPVRFLLFVVVFVFVGSVLFAITPLPFAVTTTPATNLH